MAKPKVTPWFAEDVKPTRSGVYETEFMGEPGYSFWNGRKWGDECGSPIRAEQAKNTNGVQYKRWRGLASDPRAAK